ncbi:uncharacterized protein LOC131599727 [Vicia villosa]|uniref:uncharacterized protein LOC131599727 n=1 Tax=Vicia villosa TaxID=3911 RepID=UPI00273BD549|nr:uncharacterized protein LOC131599727 [Vicia villosa]XP_058727982.1 uncharacterized protein LOC131599727 [Vicia villosa]XP_058727983.1 uncharacterized protein LOC131599727 [Vicia villosa]
MTSSYEEIRLKRIAENKKKLEALNLPKLSQSLHKSSSSSSKPSSSVKVRPRFVQPGELEVNKKRLRSTSTRKSSITPPPIETTIIPPPIKTVITPAPIQPEKDVMVEDEDEDDVVGDEIEDDVEEDEAEDVVVGDEAEDVMVEDGIGDIVKVAKSVYWDVNVINEEGYVSNTRLCVKDLVAKSLESDGTWIMLEFDKDHCAIGPASGLLAGYLGVIVRMFKDFPIMFESWRDIPLDTKTKFYDSKIKRHFLVDDGRDKEFVLASAARKWKDGRHHLFRRFYKWDLTLEENLQNYPKCRGILKNDWAIFVQYRRKEKTQKIAQKNAQNRAKLKAPHTLGSKSLARKKHELELRDGRTYSRGEMYAVSHKKSDGTFVNEDAYNNNEKLEAAIKDSVSENEAFQKVFGKEKHGYVRSMGLGVTPSQINRSTISASSAENKKIKEMQEEINALKEKNSKIDELMEAIALLTQRDNAKTKEIELLMQMQNSSGRQGLESPADGRRSSESSYHIADNGSTRKTN